MLRTLKAIILLMALVGGVFHIASAYADPADRMPFDRLPPDAPQQGMTPPGPSPQGGPSHDANNANQPSDHRERRALREERTEIRNEHEALMAERDRLKAQCGSGGSGDCQQKMQALAERRESLHERAQALRQKMGALNDGREGGGSGWKSQSGSWVNHASGDTPDHAPPNQPLPHQAPPDR